MPVASLEEVKPVLRAFEERLVGVLDRAMSDWLATPDRARFMYPRTRSTVLFDHVARHAAAEFAGESDRDVKVLRESQSIKFLFDQSVVVRFKKGNASGVGQNIVTQRTLDFVEPQRRLPELPETHRVEIVYSLDVLGTGFKEIAVVARDRRTRVWSYELGGGGAAILPLPTSRPPELQPPAVTPKRRPDDRRAVEADR